LNKYNIITIIKGKTRSEHAQRITLQIIVEQKFHIKIMDDKLYLTTLMSIERAHEFKTFMV